MVSKKQQATKTKPRLKKKKYPDPPGYQDTPGWMRMNEHTVICDICNVKGNKGDQNPIKMGPCEMQVCWQCEKDPGKVEHGRDPVQIHEIRCNRCKKWWQDHGDDHQFVWQYTGNNKKNSEQRKLEEPEIKDTDVPVKLERKRHGPASLLQTNYSDSESEDMKPRKRRLHEVDISVEGRMSSTRSNFNDSNLMTGSMSNDLMMVRYMPSSSLSNFVWDKFTAVRDEIDQAGVPSARHTVIKMRDACDYLDTLIDHWERENGSSGSRGQHLGAATSGFTTNMASPVPSHVDGRMDPREQVRRQGTASPAYYQHISERRPSRRYDATERLGNMSSRQSGYEFLTPASGFRPINPPGYTPGNTPGTPSLPRITPYTTSNRPSGPLPGSRYAMRPSPLGEVARSTSTGGPWHAESLPVTLGRPPLPSIRYFNEAAGGSVLDLAQSSAMLPATTGPRREPSVVSLDSVESQQRQAAEQLAESGDITGPDVGNKEVKEVTEGSTLESRETAPSPPGQEL